LCKDEGRDSTGNHLRLFEDEQAGWCYHGHGRVVLAEPGVVEKRNSMTYNKNTDDAYEMARIRDLKHLAYPERKISIETMEFFGVKGEVSQETGELRALFYPYTDEDGAVTGYKKRVLPKQFSALGKNKGLFGKDKVHGENFILVVEGEHDALACREMMRVLKPDTRPYNVVSIPNGANEEGTLDATTKKELEWLAKFKKVVLVLDTDGPGKATARAIAEYLSSSTDVRTASLPMKDSAALWEAGREKDWASAINSAKAYEDDCITSGDNDWDELEKPLVAGTRYSFLPRTCDKMHGFRRGEMTAWIAEANVGKSSILRQMMYEDLISHPDEHIGGFFLEEQKKKTKQSVLAYHCGVPLNKYRANPSIANPELKRDVRDKLFPRLHLYEFKTKDNGRVVLDDEHILRKITFMVRALGCKRIYFDHLSFVVGAMDTKDERRSIDVFLTKLARSVEELDYCLNIISHIKRGEREQARTDPKQKYPYWDILGMHDARGSGAIAQLSHNMIAVEKQVLDPNQENTRGNIRTRVLRAREWGFTGLGDVLAFDDEGKFKPVVIEEFS
jgi:hypothetical protein